MGGAVAGTAYGGQDPLRAYLDLLVASIDSTETGDEVPRQAHLSRFHFDHLIRHAAGESPGRLRRRILMERAAWELRNGPRTITDIGAAAGYEAAGSFTRAFRRWFDTTPTAYRERPGSHWLDAPNGIHYYPSASLGLPAASGGIRGGLTARLVGHDIWLTRCLLEAAQALPPGALDAPLERGRAGNPSGVTLRLLLRCVVETREIWTARLSGEAAPAPLTDADDVRHLRHRWDAVAAPWQTLIAKLERSAAWDERFEDALADPRGAVSFGAAVAHVLTRTAVARAGVLEALQALDEGTELGHGDPVTWERDLIIH
jgi:AraC-like DNA-binding protein